MKCSFNFIVCRALHESRTRQLWDTTCAMLARDYPDCSVTLLGGFDPVDEIPVVRVCDSDNYDSCHDKLWSVLEGNTGEEADWFIIADDDTWFNLPNLATILATLPQEESVICGCISPARLPERQDAPHAHGGCGIIISPAALRALRSVLRPWPRHKTHSDVSLALLAGMASIRWCHIVNMHDPNTAIDGIDLRDTVSVHVKDRVSFSGLYSALTEAA
jgi:hypothetical protein